MAGEGKHYRVACLVAGHLLAGVPIQGMKRSSAFTLLGKTCMLAALLLGACSKENDPAPARPACRIITSSSVSDFGTITTQYTYDSENRLIGLVNYNETAKQSGLLYEYNQKGQLSKYVSQNYRYDAASNVTVNSRTYIPEYNEKGQVSAYQSTTSSTDPAIPQTTSYSSCEYDSQGNRTRITTQSGNDAPSVDLHEYKDGNCIKTTFRVGEAFEFSVAYEYHLDRENKARTLAHVGVFGPSASKNFVKRTTQTARNNPSSVFYTERSYEFNDKGFPVKTTVAVASNSGITSIIVDTHEYNCQ